MSNCSPNQTVIYVSGLFVNEALSWWNLQVQTSGDAVAYAISWERLKEMMQAKCSRAELLRLETKFWNLTMVGVDIYGYTQRFHDLSRVVPYMVTPEFKRVERYIWGLALAIRSMVTSSHPATMMLAVTLAVSLTEEAKGSGLNNKKKENPAVKKGKAFVATTETGPKGYAGNTPKCNKCGYHHYGGCRTKLGHRSEDCWGNNKRNKNGDKKEGGSGNGNEKGKNKGCYGCGDLGHFKKDCPKEVQGHDYSFISLEFKDMLRLNSNKLEAPFAIELANGKVIEFGEIIRGCSLELGERKFNIDLLPVQLGSFDIVVGMDWLSNN
ncbi:uncharacterized protein LOC110887571 [Helianthus annuus]|uniref:uncharacterized protein LOC110887571 n=1 Tax=Helianthus annuus TaxID=4232 RepID=UPI000B8F0B74|nr:uncharacterized protein LOC110887571 [Helianthus annuus]